MTTTYAKDLVANVDIFLGNEDEPSFDAGSTYEVIGVDVKAESYIVLSEWGEIQAVRFLDNRFEKKGEAEFFRDCTFMFEGAVINGKWIWEKKKQPI